MACEYSGKVRDAFRRLGHNAVSCDLLPGETPGPHHQGDVRKLLKKGKWDLMVAHPPCTYLCSSGLHWNKRIPGRAKLTEEALAFVQLLLDAPVLHIALENPVGCISSRIRKPDQTIQPYDFGHDASKATCLWLKNLPPLRLTGPRINPRFVCPDCARVSSFEEADAWRDQKGQPRCHRCSATPILRARWGNQTDSGQNKLPPSDDRWKIRSETYQGIADAFAAQWAAFVIEQKTK